MNFYDVQELQEYLAEYNAIDKLTFDLSKTPLASNTLSDLAEILDDEDIKLELLELNLEECPIDSANVLALIQIISMKNIQAIQFNLNKSHLSNANLEHILAAITDVPEDKPVTLNLQNNDLCDKSCHALGALLRLGRYPANFSLHLGSNHLSNKGIHAICSAIKGCQQAKPNLHLNFDQTPMTNSAMKSICAMLMSGRLAEGFHLGLVNCKPTLHQIEMLARALRFGNTPKNFSLDLSMCNLSAEQIAILADSISAGRCHEGFKLDLSMNPFGDAGAVEFAKCIQSGNAPREFELDLTLCNITRVGATELEQALYSENRPVGFKLEAQLNKLSESTKSKLRKAASHMTSRDHDHYEISSIKSFLNAHQTYFAERKAPEASRILAKKFAKIIAQDKYESPAAVTAYENFMKSITKGKDLNRPFKSATIGLLFDNGLTGTDNRTVDIVKDEREELYHVELNLK